MNPGVARLAIVLALVVAGVVVLANGFSDEGTRAAPSPSTSPSPSSSPSPTKEPDGEVVGQQEGVLVQVFNGTSRSGFAADFQTELEADGYIPAGLPADAPQKPILDSIVYFTPDDARAQNKADAELLSETYLEGVAVEPLPRDLRDVVDEAADVIVVLGEDMAEAA
ncbi:MAG TPA: LytR C-terminal domain-containing protein [Actinomycetota bacterium]